MDQVIFLEFCEVDYIFFYVWYDPAFEESWRPSKIIDQPVFGYYDSSNAKVIYSG